MALHLRPPILKLARYVEQNNVYLFISIDDLSQINHRGESNNLFVRQKEVSNQQDLRLNIEQGR
jgi:hypothetical protein